MTHEVRIHPAARTDLFDLYRYIEERSGLERAGGYVARIERTCRGLADFPERGVPRGDLAPGIRTLSMERRIVLVFRIAPAVVTSLRVLYAGRDFGVDDVPR
ncbi:type II toxin-antitoxin system RelE/ParE family toxin [Methylobacterium trifolii]|uniref:Toxin ParE3 n=1 Tax=Methylobacterium trifolii TaxID=1003092 RepID=A0ABQ4U023_9HYPH|nr:type II toxin-antitoxin system RelE/ParE family toxin [Methylobacterium trifolii]GJE60348.1 Toxin ParE3 [Methylobacterium trifolii]